MVGEDISSTVSVDLASDPRGFDPVPSVDGHDFLINFDDGSIKHVL